MWRKLSKGLLYAFLAIGTLLGISAMASDSYFGIEMGFIIIIVTWLSASVFGLILEIATDISKIAANTEEVKGILKNISSPTIVKPKDTEVMVKTKDTWVCKCGKENSPRSNFCVECGEKRP